MLSSGRADLGARVLPLGHPACSPLGGSIGTGSPSRLWAGEEQAHTQAGRGWRGPFGIFRLETIWGQGRGNSEQGQSFSLPSVGGAFVTPGVGTGGTLLSAPGRTPSLTQSLRASLSVPRKRWQEGHSILSDSAITFDTLSHTQCLRIPPEHTLLRGSKACLPPDIGKWEPQSRTRRQGDGISYKEALDVRVLSNGPVQSHGGAEGWLGRGCALTPVLRR